MVYKALSFVSPVYLGENSIIQLVIEIEKVANKLKLPYEIILVDDRSPDQSWSVIQEIARNNPNLKGIRLSRNFGQHPAIMAGLSQAEGDWIVVLDCDLQDQPKEVEKLYKVAMEGYDIVLAKRSNRKDTIFKKITSKLFSKTYSYLTDVQFDNSIANFGIYNRKVIEEVIRMNDYLKSFPLFVNWLGFRSIGIDVEHEQRRSGTSSYSIKKLLKLAFDTIISFSNKPLKIVVKFGLFISLISFIFGSYTIYKYFNHDINVLGYSSLIVSIWFLSGVIITIIGVVGIYIGKIFDQSKNRPAYIIDKIEFYEDIK